MKKTKIIKPPSEPLVGQCIQYTLTAKDEDIIDTLTTLVFESQNFFNSDSSRWGTYKGTQRGDTVAAVITWVDQEGTPGFN